MKALKLGFTALVLILSMLLSVAANAQEIDSVGSFQTAELTPQLEKEIKCLAQNIYYEAGSEPYNGKVAVAQVTMNRVESGRFANTVCGVVKQKTFWQGSTVCQFSWFCTPKAKLRIPDSINYQESLMVAQRVLLEGFGLQHLQEALYFHATHVNPNWGKVKVAKIGNHIFYRDHK